MLEGSRDCPDCGSPREFAQHHPAGEFCPDSPDGCCPEWYCLECGAALLIGFGLAGSVARNDGVAHTGGSHAAVAGSATGRLDRVA
jgi:hypothetical protein